LVADDLESGIMLWTMESTGVGVSRAWNSRISAVKVKNGNSVTQAPIFAKVWELSTVKVVNEQGKYYTVDTKAIKDLGWITADQFPVVQAAFNEVQELKGRPIMMTEAEKSDDTQDAPPF